MTNDPVVLDLATVAARIGRGKRWVCRMAKAGRFPAPMPQYGRPMWRASIVEAWLNGAWGGSRFFASARHQGRA